MLFIIFGRVVSSVYAVFVQFSDSSARWTTLREVPRLQAALQAQRLAAEEEGDRAFRAEQLRKRAEALAEKGEAEKVRGHVGNLRIRKRIKNPCKAPPKKTP